ncbi:MAG: SH3 domain-containing protein [Lachnospiraceae bacterium]|nr:SH3 domain-containing protein [Lachnospiraceae bacterium]
MFRTGKMKNKALVLVIISLAFILLLTGGCGKKSAKRDGWVEVEIEKIEEPMSVTRAVGDGSENADGADDESELESEEVTKELTVDFSKVTSFDSPKTMYAVSNVNIRKGPSTDFESVGMLKLGEEIETIGQDAEGWYEFDYKGLTVFACDDYLSDEKPEVPTPSPEEETKESTEISPDITEPVAEEEAEVESEPAEEVDPADVLIIGDSRCVMMKSATSGGGCSWICKSSKGYKWFESTAIPEADTMIGNGTKVVICLGVNDVGNVNKYAKLVNSKAEEWAEKGAKTYYVSVNPVQDNARVSQAQIEFFNAKLQSQLVGISWIDTHSYLMSNGYVTTDGLHYNNTTSRTIFQVIMSSL